MKASVAALVLFLLGGTTPVCADPVPIDQYRNGVLSGELEAQQVPRLAAYRECLALKQHLNSPEFSFLRALERRFREAQDPSIRPFEKTLALLDVDQRLYAAESSSACKTELTRARIREDGLSRKKFRVAFALTPSKRLLQELDPQCAVHVRADWGGQEDGNPCFAGAAIVLRRSFPAFDSRMEDALDRFEAVFASLRERVTAAHGGDRIDLAQEIGSPEAAAALMSLSLTSATSANGYVDAYGIPLIRGTWRAGGDALTAYKRYMRVKNLADLGRAFLEGVHRRQLTLTLLGEDVSGWNRHNWMAVSLSLHYEAQGKRVLSRELPVFLGTMYESRDAVSHLREGSSLRETWNGFRDDRSRYVQGVRLARKIRSLR